MSSTTSNKTSKPVIPTFRGLAPTTLGGNLDQLQDYFAKQHGNPKGTSKGQPADQSGPQEGGFKKPTVKFDDGEHFEIYDNDLPVEDLLFARSLTFFIEFQTVESQKEYLEKKRYLQAGGVADKDGADIDAEVREFVRNWMLLHSFSQGNCDLKVPWLGCLKKEWNDRTAWIGRTNPCGDNKVKFFHVMQVSDHFGEYSFRIAGEQVFLYITEAVLETYDGQETTYQDGKRWCFLDDFTEINIKEGLYAGAKDGNEDSSRGFNRFGQDVREKSKDEKIVAQAYAAQVHQAFLLLLMYAIRFRRVRRMTLLEGRAITRAREIMNDRLQGCDHLVDAICKEFWELSKIHPGDEYSVGRGMLFHGPPGTGKTTLISFLPQLVGMTLITDLIPATSLRRGLVGETDTILMQFGMRAAYQPWRLTVLSLDEIETLVKKRPENAEKAGDSSVNTLLGLIAGGSNVPTLHIMGSTNMGNSIDAALLRRLLDGFFFVGLMNREARTAMIEARIFDSYFQWRVESLTEFTKKKLYFLNDEVKLYFVYITMNLGGSHLQAIINRILSAAEELHRLGFNKAFCVTKELCYVNTRHVCAKQSLYLGDSYLCDYFRQSTTTLGVQHMCALPKRVADLRAPDIVNLTGRILVNLRDSDTKDVAFDYLPPSGMFVEANFHQPESAAANSRRGTDSLSHQHRILEPIDCTIRNSSRPATIQDVIVMCTMFSVANNVDLLKVFGGAWLKQHNLSKEDDAMTKLSQEIFDTKEYKSVMFVFDIDSLIVSEYQPQDNDYSSGTIEQVAMWKALLYQVLEIARSANVYVQPLDEDGNVLENQGETEEDRERINFINNLRNNSEDSNGGWQFSTSETPQTRWVVFVTQNPSSLAAFQRAIRFPRTSEELINIAENEMMNKEKRCTLCDQTFCWAENEAGCRWHMPTATIKFEGTDIPRIHRMSLRSRKEAIKSLSTLSPEEKQRGVWSCCGSACTTFECSMRDDKHVRVPNEGEHGVFSLEQEKQAIVARYPNKCLMDVITMMEERYGRQAPPDNRPSQSTPFAAPEEGFFDDTNESYEGVYYEE